MLIQDKKTRRSGQIDKGYSQKYAKTLKGRLAIAEKENLSKQQRFEMTNKQNLHPNLSMGEELHQKIESVNCSHQQLCGIPKNIFHYASTLKSIDLSCNNIKKIEIDFCKTFQSQSLNTLNFSHNQISQVPIEIELLAKSLRNIDVSYNKLWYVSQIQGLKKLKQQVEKLGDTVEIGIEGNCVSQTNCREVHALITPTMAVGQREAKVEAKKNSLFESRRANSPHQKINCSLADISQIISSFPHSSLITERKQSRPSITNEQSKGVDSEHQQSEGKQSPNFKGTEFQSQIQYHNELMIGNKFSTFAKLLTQSSKFQGIHRKIYPYLNALHSLQKKMDLILEKVSFLNTKDSKIGIIQNLEQNCKLSMVSIQSSIQILDKLLLLKEGKAEQAFRFHEVIEGTLTILSKNRHLILDKHSVVLQMLIDVKDIEVNQKELQKLYETWFHQFKKVDQVTNTLSEEVLNPLIHTIKRVLKIHKMTIMDPQQIKDSEYTATHGIQRKIFDDSSEQKSAIQITDQSRWSSQKKQKLGELLFSAKGSVSNSQSKKLCSKTQRAQNSLLLSDSKKESAQIKLQLISCEECFQCPLFKLQVERLEKANEKLSETIAFNSRERQKLLQEIQKLTNQKALKEDLILKQSEIVSQLECIKPSTYQNVMLQQARALEGMIQFEGAETMRNRYYSNISQSPDQHSIKTTTQAAKRIESPWRAPSSKHNQNEAVCSRKLTKNQRMKSQMSLKKRSFFKNNEFVNEKQSNKKSILSRVSKSKQTRCHTVESTDQIQRSTKEKHESRMITLNSQSQLKPFTENCQVDTKSRVEIVGTSKQTQSYKEGQTLQPKINVTEFRLSEDQVNLKGVEHQTLQKSEIQVSKSESLLKQNKTRFCSELRQHESEVIKEPLNGVFEVSSYRYQEIDLRQNERYIQYVDHHLRNNIKEILSKKTGLGRINQTKSQSKNCYEPTSGQQKSLMNKILESTVRKCKSNVRGNPKDLPARSIESVNHKKQSQIVNEFRSIKLSEPYSEEKLLDGFQSGYEKTQQAQN